jgi:predicted dithiol-disulfide oxidoreductase (DUF899 family)
MGQFHEHRFPGESDGYREARDKLLAAETDLRRRIEAVAELRRSLPPGGVAEDYVFEEGAADLSDRETVTRTKLSELFQDGKTSLVLYSFMYPPNGNACPMCTAFLDGLNGSARHIGARANLAVVAKGPGSGTGATFASCRPAATATTGTIWRKPPMAPSGRS